MGRLVGDGALIWYIQDVIVLPECQGLGIGKAIVVRLTDYARTHGLPGTNVAIGLMSARGQGSVLRKAGVSRAPERARRRGHDDPHKGLDKPQKRPAAS